MRVLLVDDYQPFRACLAKYLANHGAEVVEAGDGKVALELTRQRGFDVIVLDVEMPTMDGVEMFTRLDPVHAARTLLVTAGGRFEREGWVGRFADDRVFWKPVDLDRLMKAIESLALARHLPDVRDVIDGVVPLRGVAGAPRPAPRG